MNRLYQKSELLFSLLWIGLYVVLFSIADNISIIIGIDKCITAVIALVFVIILVYWIKKQGLIKKYGLCKLKISFKSCGYFIPLILIASCNFWNGIKGNDALLETILFIISMIAVGIIEEIIFRGFLFKALSKDDLTTAIIISSVTFGFGHIVNLLNGAPLFSTILQIIYATAVGFAFTIVFYRSGSLIPCIITHSFVNATSIFMIEASIQQEMIFAIIMSMIAIIYGLWLYQVKVWF